MSDADRSETEDRSETADRRQQEQASAKTPDETDDVAESGEDRPADEDTPTFKERARLARTWFRERYMQLDPRTLGIYRIVIGLLLCADCLRHWSFARRFYSNDGVLTNHWHLFAPSSEFNFSLFHSFSSLPEVHVAFALSLFCYAMFTVGFKTRLFNVLALIWVTSMDNRMVMVENGGYVVVNLTVFWAMFLPTGRRFSVDAWRASWRRRSEGTIDALNDREQRDDRPYVSLLSFIILLNFAIVYIFNVVNKYGSTWRTGKTTHFVLHIDRMVTLPAVWLRELLPYPVHMASTWLVLVVEALIVMTILWPRDRLIARPTANVLILLLHTAFGVMMRLGPFSWFMIGFSSILMMRCHWEWLGERHRDKTPGVTVRIQETSGVAWWLARVLKRLDPTDRLLFEGGGDEPLTADQHTGRAALWRATRALPLGRILTPTFRIITLGGLDLVATTLLKRDQSFARFFGLTAPPPNKLTTSAAPSPLRVTWNRWMFLLHELAIVYLTVCAASQVINENKSIPKKLKHTAPKVMRATVGYPRIFQGWGMFAPNPIREDGIMAVDAITVDGRHVDPFTGKEPDLNLSDARGTGFDQIEQDYFNRIRLDHNRTHRNQLERWIKRYHLRTGRAEDEIVHFNVYWLRDQNPDPGLVEPTQHEKLCIHTFKNRKHRPKPPLPPLPKKCKVVSADKDKLHEKEKAEREAEQAKRPWLERALTF